MFIPYMILIRCSMIAVSLAIGATAIAPAPKGGGAILTGSHDDAAALGIALTTDRARYAPGERIAARLTVSSRGQALTLHFNSAQRCDFAILDEGGATVWRWGADRMFGQALGEETLGPARPDLVCSEQFAAPRTAGTYRIVGTLVAGDRPMSATVAVAVVDPVPGGP